MITTNRLIKLVNALLLLNIVQPLDSLFINKAHEEVSMNASLKTFDGLIPL